MGYASTAKRYYNSGKRKYRRAKVWANTPQTPKQLAIQAYKGVRYLKGLVNSEMLHNQVSGSVSVNNSTGQVISLTSIGQNDTDAGRTGNSILARNLFIRLGITQNSSATSTFYRIMLVLDTQQVADTAPTIAQILQSASTLSPLNDDNTGRFKIMQNWFFTTDNTKNTTRVIEKYYKIYKHVRFNGTTSSDIQKNGMYLVMLSDQSTNTPSIAYNVKLGYHDN